MPNVTVSQDIDSFIKSVDKLSARTSLGLGTAATGFTHAYNSPGPAYANYIPVYGPEEGMIKIGTSNVINGVLRYATGGGVVDTYFASETFNFLPSYGTGCGSVQIQFPPGGPTPSNMRLLANGNTAPRDYTFPDASGTFTLTSDLSGYVPITRTVNGQSLSGNITISISGSTIPISSVTGLGAGVATALALSADAPNGFVRRIADGSIVTYGTNESIYALGANSFIAADGVNSFIQSKGTFKLDSGTFVTTLSHRPTSARTITFPDASGTIRLLDTPVTLGSLSGAVTFNRDSGQFQNATVTSSLTANVSGGSDWNALDLWITALSGADRTLDLNAAIQKPSDSAVAFPVTITSGKGCRVKFEKHGATWMLVSLVKSYTL